MDLHLEVKQKIRTKNSNNPDIRGRVVIKDVNGRAKILKWEKFKVGAYRKRYGSKALPENKRPSSKSIAKLLSKILK